MSSPTGLSCLLRTHSTGLQEASGSSNGQFGSPRKLPSGRFQVRYFHLGRRITGDTTFPTKGDSRAFLDGVETDIRRGNFFDPTAGRVTLAEYSDW